MGSAAGDGSYLGAPTTFNEVEEHFFEMAQERTDTEDEDTDYSHGYEAATRRTGTVQAVAMRASRCHSIFR
jgi:hypothetical protein